VKNKKPGAIASGFFYIEEIKGHRIIFCTLDHRRNALCLYDAITSFFALDQRHNALRIYGTSH
jgi:hypothetical protein